MRGGIGRWLRRAFELQEPGQARLLPMEGLRGLAVALVFLQHFGTQAAGLLAPLPGAMFAGPVGAAMTAFREQGNTGVELFFVLSGYLIYGHLVQRRPPFGRFMARRATRLYPAFLCVFAIAAGLDLLRPSPLIPPAPAAAVAMVAANLLFLPGLLRLQPILAVAWSLSYEVFFYIAAALLVAALSLERLPRGGRIALILGLAAAFEIATWWHGPNLRGEMRTLDLAWQSPEWSWPEWDWPDRMLPFFFGMLLAEGVGLRRPVPAALGLAAPALCCAALSVWWVPDLLHEAAVSVAFFLLCAASFRDGSGAARLFAWPPLRWLGNMSYSYYLLHGFVVLLVARAVLQLAGPLPPAAVVALLPVAFLASLLPTAALFLLVEKPVSLRPHPRRAARVTVAHDA